MGYLEYQTSEVRLAESPSESARFGFASDRLTVGESALDAAGSLGALSSLVQAALEGSESRVTILRYPSRLLGLLRDVDLGDARAQPAGTLLYWEAPDHDGDYPGNGVVEVRGEGRAAAEPGLLETLRDSFDGYTNHYSANPLIAEGVVVEGYAEWAATTIRNPASRVFASVVDGAPVGVAVVAASEDLWEIELASIRTAYQARGLYLDLIAALLRSARAEGARVVISTQAHNIGVQRAWAKLGFRPISSIDTVHVIRRTGADWR